jgi:hypothetical protein
MHVEETPIVGYYNTFVVKIWCDDSRKMARGYIQHVSTQELSYFLDFESMNDFMVNHLGSPLSNAGAGDGREGGLSIFNEGIGHIGRDE